MADIRFFCPHCKGKLVVDITAAGVQAKCSHCSKIVLIPSQSTPGIQAGAVPTRLTPAPSGAAPVVTPGTGSLPPSGSSTMVATMKIGDSAPPAVVVPPSGTKPVLSGAPAFPSFDSRKSVKPAATPLAPTISVASPSLKPNTNLRSELMTTSKIADGESPAVGRRDKSALGATSKIGTGPQPFPSFETAVAAPVIAANVPQTSSLSTQKIAGEDMGAGLRDRLNAMIQALQQENDKFRSRLAELESTQGGDTAGMKKEINRLAIQLADSTVEVSRLRREVESKKAELDKLRGGMPATPDASPADAAKRNEELKAALVERERQALQIASLQTSLAAMQQRIAVLEPLESRVKLVEDERKRLIVQVGELETMRARCDSLQTEIGELSRAKGESVARMKDMRQQVDRAHEDARVVREELDRVRETLQNRAIESAGAQETIRALEGKLAAAEQARAGAERDAASLREEGETATRSIDQLRQRVDSVIAEREALLRQRGEWEQKLAQAEAAGADAAQKLAAATSAAAENVTVLKQRQAEVDALKQQIAALEDGAKKSAAKAESAATDLESRLKSAETARDAAVKELADMRMSSTDAGRALTERQAEIDALKQRIAAMESEAKAAASKSDDAVADRQKALADLESKLKAVEAAKDAVDKQLADAKTASIAAERALKDRQAEIDTLKVRLAAMESNTRLATAKGESAVAEQQRARAALEEKLKAAEAARAGVEKQLAEAKAFSADVSRVLKERQVENGDLRQRLATLESEVKSAVANGESASVSHQRMLGELEAKLKVAESARAEAADHLVNAKAASLDANRALKQRQSEVDALKQRVAAMESEARTAVAEQQRVRGDLESKLKASEAARAGVVQQLADVRSSSADAGRALEEHQVAIDAMKGRVAALESELDKANTRVKETAAERDAAVAAIRTLEEKAAHQVMLGDDLDTRLKAAEAAAAQARKEMEAARGASVELDGTLRKRQAELDGLKQRMAAVEADAARGRTEAEARAKERDETIKRLENDLLGAWQAVEDQQKAAGAKSAEQASGLKTLEDARAKAVAEASTLQREVEQLKTARSGIETMRREEVARFEAEVRRLSAAVHAAESARDDSAERLVAETGRMTAALQAAEEAREGANARLASELEVLTGALRMAEAARDAQVARVEELARQVKESGTEAAQLRQDLESARKQIAEVMAQTAAKPVSGSDAVAKLESELALLRERLEVAGGVAADITRTQARLAELEAENQRLAGAASNAEREEKRARAAAEPVSIRESHLQRRVEELETSLRAAEGAVHALRTKNQARATSRPEPAHPQEAKATPPAPAVMAPASAPAKSTAEPAKDVPTIIDEETPPRRTMRPALGLFCILTAIVIVLVCALIFSDKAPSGEAKDGAKAGQSAK